MVEPELLRPTSRQTRVPAVMLVVACLFWGMGFSWAKNVGASLNEASGLPVGAAFGPIVGLAIRFGAGAILWIAFAPGARQGWTIGTVRRGVTLGAVLTGGVASQHLGLDRTNEATSAFLTSLTIVIVPIMLAVLGRQLSTARLGIAIVIALVGIWLLTGAWAGGFGWGEWLGVGCAVLFSVEMLLLNDWIPADSPWRVTGVMFLTLAILCGGAAAVLPGASHLDVHCLVNEKFLSELGLLTILTTVTAFGLMNVYQPKVNPTRATLIYLMEPLFAAAFAWIHNGRAMSGRGMIGAALIVLANVTAEVKWPRSGYKSNIAA